VNLLKQLQHPGRRLNAQLFLQKTSAEAVLTDGLGRVALFEMDADYRPVRALPEWLGRYCAQSRLERLFESPPSREPLAKRVQRMQPDLPEPLPFEQYPIVVPVRQQIVAELRRLETLLVRLANLEDPIRRRLSLAEIDRDLRGEPELLAYRVDQSWIAAVQPPERRTQVCARSFLGRVQPQDAGDIEPL
jgi:hypothetical protein